LLRGGQDLARGRHQSPNLSGPLEFLNAQVSEQEGLIDNMKLAIDAMYAEEVRMNHTAEMLEVVIRAAGIVDSDPDANVTQIASRAYQKLAVIGTMVVDSIKCRAQERDEDFLSGGFSELQQAENNFHENYVQSIVGPMLESLCHSSTKVRTDAEELLDALQLRCDSLLNRKEEETDKLYDRDCYCAELQQREIALAEPLLEQVRGKPHSERLCAAAMTAVLVGMKWRKQDIPESWLAFLWTTMKTHASERILRDGCRALGMSATCGLGARPESFECLLEALRKRPDIYTIQQCGRSSLLALIEEVDRSGNRWNVSADVLHNARSAAFSSFIRSLPVPLDIASEDVLPQQRRERSRSVLASPGPLLCSQSSSICRQYFGA